MREAAEMTEQVPRTVAVDALAERLGVSPWTVRTWLRQGRVPYFKLGRRVLVRLDDVDALLARNYHAATR